MKVREEHETAVADGEVLLTILHELGLDVRFRYEKYREEYTAGDVIVALDETPIGTFVEIEGGEAGILAMAQALGRSPADFVLESYRSLFVAWRAEQGLTGGDMIFPAT